MEWCQKARVYASGRGCARVCSLVGEKEGEGNVGGGTSTTVSSNVECRVSNITRHSTPDTRNYLEFSYKHNFGFQQKAGFALNDLLRKTKKQE